jgi:hypothetical protein
MLMVVLCPDFCISQDMYYKLEHARQLVHLEGLMAEPRPGHSQGCPAFDVDGKRTSDVCTCYSRYSGFACGHGEVYHQLRETLASETNETRAAMRRSYIIQFREIAEMCAPLQDHGRGCPAFNTAGTRTYEMCDCNSKDPGYHRAAQQHRAAPAATTKQWMTQWIKVYTDYSDIVQNIVQHCD